MITSIKPRGRAASPIRPGLMVKQFLSGELPLADGRTVSEASIVELFNAYKSRVDYHNQFYERKHAIKGMNHRSFYTMFRFAQLLGLVEFVREEAADWHRTGQITKSSSLTRVERSPETGRLSVRVSNRKVFKLTSIGELDVKSWLDLTRAWKEQWAAPQVVPIPIYKVADEDIVSEDIAKEEIMSTQPAKRGRKLGSTAEKTQKTPAEKVVVPTLKLKTSPSAEEYRRLITHLEELQEFSASSVKVAREVERLTGQVGEWVVDLIETEEDAKNVGAKNRAGQLKKLRLALTEIDENLMDMDLQSAIDNLKKLLQS